MTCTNNSLPAASSDMHSFSIYILNCVHERRLYCIPVEKIWNAHGNAKLVTTINCKQYKNQVLGFIFRLWGARSIILINFIKQNKKKSCPLKMVRIMHIN